MSSGNSGNPFPNIVSNMLTPGLKRFKRLAEKCKAGRHHLYPVVFMQCLLAQEQYQLILAHYPVASTYYLQVLVHKPLT